MRASAPLAAAGSLTILASPPEASCAWWRKDAAAKEAERKAALSPLERLAEFGKDVSTSDGPAAVADKALKEIGVLASEALATGYPNQVGWGFCAGYCTGFAAKKVGKVGFVVVGSMYALLQTAAYHGYVTVDHAKISRKFTQVLDANKDGRVDSKDAQDLYGQAMKVLEFNGRPALERHAQRPPVERAAVELRDGGPGLRRRAKCDLVSGRGRVRAQG